MCYHKIHHCNYCDELYPCSLIDVLCPTVNDDEDANMCDACRQKLEDKLAEFEDSAFTAADIKDILK